MKLLRGLKSLEILSSGSAITIGNFDGLHLGHQQLLLKLKKEAASRNLPTVVILFEPQPNEFFQKEKAPARLTTFREKWTFLLSQGIDYVYCLKFNQKIASLSAETFVHEILFQVLHAHFIIVGSDFRFGQNRQGDVTLLQQIGKDENCQIEVCSDFCVNDMRISSTAIRQALAKGDLIKAARFLGRPYSISGRVVRGQGLGRQWGIPTANIYLKRLMPALTGVFLVKINDGYGVANLGCRPTLKGQHYVLEVHLFDHTNSLYHKRLNVVFLHQLRVEQKFSSIDALIAQIHLDIAQAKAMIPHLTR